jgi:hypothetical protein
MTNDSIHVDPMLRTPWKKVVRQPRFAVAALTVELAPA